MKTCLTCKRVLHTNSARLGNKECRHCRARPKKAAYYARVKAEAAHIVSELFKNIEKRVG